MIKSIEITIDTVDSTVLFKATYRDDNNKELPWRITAIRDKQKFLDWLDKALEEVEIRR